MSIFAHVVPSFESFLQSAKTGVRTAVGGRDNTCFIARNFINEEKLSSSRVSSYSAFLPPAGPTDFSHWNDIHNRYLKREVFVTPPPLHDFEAVAVDDAQVCPETFRSQSTSLFSNVDLDTDLIRLVPAADLAWLTRRPEKDVIELGKAVLAGVRSASVTRPFDDLLEDAFAAPDCQHRPAFAAFYEDFLAELTADTEEWPDILRDRLGLYHINQWLPGGLPRAVLLFRYQVRELPTLIGSVMQRPLVAPCVADHRLFVAFCPSPVELDRGRLISLVTGGNAEPAREVLHLFMPLRARHLFKIGLVTKPVPSDLSEFRRDHLIWLQILSGRDAYARDTDTDLLVKDSGVSTT